MRPEQSSFVFNIQRKRLCTTAGGGVQPHVIVEGKSSHVHTHVHMCVQAEKADRET
jgi:hypothetical protein